MLPPAGGRARSATGDDVGHVPAIVRHGIISFFIIGILGA